MTILIDFVNLIREMRACQREYFKTRDKGILQKSKKLEKRVDEMLSEQGNFNFSGSFRCISEVIAAVSEMHELLQDFLNFSACSSCSCDARNETVQEAKAILARINGEKNE